MKSLGLNVCNFNCMIMWQVTMDWWTHLWLNEGFASWIMCLCVDHTHPALEIWNIFLSREYPQVLSLDSMANSHPIEVSTK